MSPQHQKMHWQHTEDGLVLNVLGRAEKVPDVVAEHLVGPTGLSTSTRPDEDLVRLEGLLRNHALQQHERVAAAEAAVSVALIERDQLVEQRGVRARRHQRRAAEKLHSAAAAHTEAINTLDQIWEATDRVRTFVAELDVAQGLLSETAAGWRRSPRMPASVIAFPDEETFLATDPRRAMMSEWGGSSVAGDDHGLRWRRDGDDDPREPPLTHGGGTWRLGFIPTTGEVYALRRSDLQPEELWLISVGWPDDTSTRRLLSELEEHMRQPNSLLLLAQRLRDARGTASGK